MPKLEILNQTGSKVANITLSDHVFGIEPHKQALYDVVNAQRAAMRQGTAAVKSRSFVSGGGRRPWRQKGTGRARQGSIRSAQWRGGGIIFGPQPRSYKIKLNQKVRNLALRSALSYHAKQNTLVVVDALKFEEPKTKLFQNFLNSLKISSKVLVIDKDFDFNTILACQNIPYVQYADASQASVYDILNAKNLIITKDAVAVLEEVLTNE